MSITINSIFGKPLFVAESAQDVRSAVREAIAAKADLRSADLRSADLSYANLSYADLRSADLRSADLSSANLSYADLRYANLRYANLSSANLSYADLRSANLSYANLSSANLSSANLSYADLRYANLSSADLRYANLSSANLSYADLRSANLSSANPIILSVTGLPSGHAILMPTPDGWSLRVGCWTGTVAALREMIAKDTGWPEAIGTQVLERRPMLAAFADMCDAWTAPRQWALDEVIAKWKTAEAEAVQQ